MKMINDYEMAVQLTAGGGRIVHREWDDESESNAGTVAVLGKSAGYNGRLRGSWIANGRGGWEKLARERENAFS